MLYTTDAATARQMIPNIILAFKFLILILSRSHRVYLVEGRGGEGGGWDEVGDGDEGYQMNGME